MFRSAVTTIEFVRREDRLFLLFDLSFTTPIVFFGVVVPLIYQVFFWSLSQQRPKTMQPSGCVRICITWVQQRDTLTVQESYQTSYDVFIDRHCEATYNVIGSCGGCWFFLCTSILILGYFYPFIEIPSHGYQCSFWPGIWKDVEVLTHYWVL